MNNYIRYVDYNKKITPIANLIVTIYFSIFLLQIVSLMEYRLYNFMIYLLFGFIFVVSILSFKNNLFYFFSKSWKIYIVVFFAIILQSIFFPELNPLLLKGSVRFILLCLPAYILFRNISDIQLLIRKFLKMFHIIFWVCLSYEIFYRIGIISKPITYSMGLSYSIILFILIATLYEKSKNTNIKIIFLIIFMLEYGSRGAILTYFITLMVYYYNFLFFKKKYVILGIMFVSSFLVYKTKYVIFHIIYLLFTYFNISSRTILLFNQKDIHLSGRGQIWTKTLTAIFDSPFSIKGVFSDHSITGINNYPHNLILELLYQFGVILGGVLVCVIFVIFLKSILNTDRTKYGKLVIILSCISIVKLMMSSTLWESLEFWSWMGLYFNIHYKNKKNREKLGKNINEKDYI